MSSLISANGVAVMSDTPDIANVRIEFDNGCVANLTSPHLHEKMRKMRLFQKDAYIGIDFPEKKTEIIRAEYTGDKNVFTPSISKPTTERKTIAIANPPVADERINRGTREIPATPSRRIPKTPVKCSMVSVPWKWRTRYSEKIGNATTH